MTEQRRGCGWRKIGGTYLCGEGGRQGCDALPIELVPCSICGYEVSFSRGIQMIRLGYLVGRLQGHECKDEFPCPICALKLLHVEDVKGENFALMYVSSRAYSTDSFKFEAERMGVSKRIAPQSIPKDFKLGEHWIYLAHNKTILKSEEDGEKGLRNKEPKVGRAIFYAFRPNRIEIILWKGTPQKEVDEYKKKGYTPVFIERTPENIKRHAKSVKKPKIED